MKIRRYLLIGLLLSLLAACAGPVSQLVSPTDVFSRAGRFALNYHAPLEKPYAAQGGFSWLDDGQELTIDLNNPMGSIIARVLINENQSILTYANGDIQTAATPDDLLAAIWGHAIPVTGLRYWVQGKTLPNTLLTDVKRNDNGKLTSFEQLGWQVQLDNYDALGPKKIRLLRLDGQTRLNLRFVIN